MQTFDTLDAVERFEAADIETPTAKALASELRKAADADREELVTRGEFYRRLWMQGACIVAILTALRFLPIPPT